MGERKSYRISGLNSAVDGLNGLLFREAQEAEPDLMKLHSVFQQEGSSLVRAMNTAGIQAGNLPTRSMRAAAWILYMQSENRLVSHMHALKNTIGYLEEAGLQQFMLEFSYSSYLFRFKPQRGFVKVIFHEGFTNAPPAILQAAAKIGSAAHRRNSSRAQVAAYARSEGFRKVQAALEQYSRAVFVDSDAKGQLFDLKIAFDRVNWAYFEGKQSLPHLCWSGSRNYRKLGHYNPVSDTIQISSLLDQKNTPEYVVDFVLYHELLHRDLGIVQRNHRKIAHRTEFRHQEQDFAHYDAAQHYLRQLASQR